MTTPTASTHEDVLLTLEDLHTYFFTDIGVARQHVLVQGRYEDEVLLERTL